MNDPFIQRFNTLRLRQNDCHFPDDIFKFIFVNENAWISIEIPLKFVPMCQMNNIPTLVHIMAWCQSGDKPLSAPMMVSLLTHIYASHGPNELTICCRCVYWPSLCVLPQITPGVRHTGYQGKRAGHHSSSHRVLLHSSGSSRDNHSHEYNEVFPQLHWAHTVGRERCLIICYLLKYCNIL